MTNTSKMSWLRNDYTAPKEDLITDQSLTIMECRTLLEIILAVEILVEDESLQSTWNPHHKKMLKRLKQKAHRGAAMETPRETQERHQKND
jgi:hypothetical protein